MEQLFFGNSADFREQSLWSFSVAVPGPGFRCCFDVTSLTVESS